MAVNWAQIAQIGATVAPAVANIASQRAKGRADEAKLSEGYDRGTYDRYEVDKRLDLEALINQYRAELDRSKGINDEYEMRMKAPQQRASNSVRGDILANVQDVGVSAPDGVNVTSFSGGLRPSLLSGNSRALGQQMSKEALLDALDGSPQPFSAMQPFDVSSITSRRAPGQTPMQEPGTLDKVMENIALWGGLAGVGYNAFNAPRPNPIQARALPTNTAAGLVPAPSSANPFA
jgi:hypothetical protein